MNSSLSAARSLSRSALLNRLSSRGSIFLKLNWSVASSNSSGLAGGSNYKPDTAALLRCVRTRQEQQQQQPQQRTEVVSIGSLLVLIPRYLVVFVQVVVRPHLRHILVNVTLLHPFDPGFQFGGADETIAIAVYPVHYFTARAQT